MLRDPAATRAETERFVGSFIRPRGLHQRATPIFADAVTRLGEASAPAAERAPAWQYLVRPLLLAAIVPVLFIEAFDDNGVVTRSRKRIRGFVHRGRKRLTKTGARWKRYFEGAW